MGVNMNIQKYTSIKDIKKMYSEIYQNYPPKHAFQCLRFLEETDTIYYRLRWHSKVYYYVVFDDETPIIIAGFRKYDTESFILVGSRAGYDYCDIIWSDSRCLEKGIKCLFNQLKKENIKCIIWKFWDENSASLDIIRKIATVTEITQVKNTKINIGQYDSYEAYWGSLKKHAKQNVRTAYNRINREDRKLEFNFYDSAKIISKAFHPQLEEYLNLYLRRQAVKYEGGKFLHQLHLSKFNYITRSLKNSNAIMMDIRLDGKLAAFMQGTLNSDKSEYEIPRLAINEEFSFYSPGLLLVNECIKYMIKNTNIKIFNLCRGDEKYKYDMGGVNYYTLNAKILL